MTKLEEYIVGRWSAGFVPTVRNAAASLRMSTAEVFERAIEEGMLLGGNGNCSTGGMSIFPSLQIYRGLDNGTQDAVLNVLDSSSWFREDSRTLTGAAYLAEPSREPEPEVVESVEPDNVEPEAGSEPDVVESEPEAEPEAEKNPTLEQAEEFYDETIPHRSGWELNSKHPYQLPVEAYADWKMAHGELGLGNDVLIPSHELHRVAKSLRVPSGRIKILSGDEAGQRAPTDPRFQAFREKGRKYFTSSTLTNLKEASKATYQRKSWIR